MRPMSSTLSYLDRYAISLDVAALIRMTYVYNSALSTIMIMTDWPDIDELGGREQD